MLAAGRGIVFWLTEASVRRLGFFCGWQGNAPSAVAQCVGPFACLGLFAYSSVGFSSCLLCLGWPWLVRLQRAIHVHHGCGVSERAVSWRSWPLGPFAGEWVTLV